MTGAGKISKAILVLALLVGAECFGQLRISANNRYLYEKQTGLPVFLNGESVWCLFTAITYTQADTFFQNCQQYGINFLETCIIEDGFTTTSGDWGAPNTNGDTPFSTNSFTTPRASYFTHCDSIIGLAKTYGIYIHAYISYLGGGSFEGWQTEIGASSNSDVQGWGSWIAGRYKDSTNIMWGVTGDCDPTTWKSKIGYIVTGVLSQDTNHIITPRDQTNSRTTTNWPDTAWAKLDYIYPYWGPNEGILQARIRDLNLAAYNDGRPAFFEEGWYENESQTVPPTNTELRLQAYYSLLTGSIVGNVFGNCPMWHFGKGHNGVCGSGTWQSWLDSQGHVSMGWLGKLCRSRRWWTLLPDNSDAVMTAGEGTDQTRAACSYTVDSSSIMVYLPTSRQITVNLSYVKSDSAHCWWFNPSDGSTTDLGMKSRTSQNFTPSSGDWVFVADAKSITTFNAPGQDTTAIGSATRLPWKL